MNKKPFLLRSFFALVVVVVFVASMFPLTQSDFYKTLEGLVENPENPELQAVIADARALQKQDEVMYESAAKALEEAAEKRGVSLIQHVKPLIVKSQKLINNSDVISLVRKNAAGSIRLGIDLNGGAEFMLLLEPQDKNVSYDRLQFDRFRDTAIETLRKRLESQNIFETEISPSGQNLVSMRVPLVTKEEKANLEKLISMTAQLQFKLVHPNSDAEVERYLQDPDSYTPPEGTVIMENIEFDNLGRMQKQYFLVERETQMSGEEIQDAFVQIDQAGRREIAFQLKPSGTVRFGDITKNNIGRRLAIILDGKLYSAPNIQSAIPGGRGVITGSFSKEDAENIANALVSGSVPFKISVVQKSDIDPMVGKQTVRDSLFSGIAGTILVMLFMLIYYRISGLIANISLVVNALLILGALAAFDVTLTLPGIAGIVLTIGMAVDANVLIYERIREELAAGKTLLNAVDIGFSRAFTAIFDSNLTTLFTALILLWQGTGAIKGFAMTLAIGIFTTLFTAVFLTRLLFDIMFRIPWLHITNLRMMSFLKSPHINFLGQRKIALSISLLLIVFSFAVLAVKGKDVLGVDFTGGTQLEMDFEKMIPAEEITRFMNEQGYDAKTAYKTTNAVGNEQVLELLVRPQRASGKETLSAGDSHMLETITSELNRKFPSAKFVAKRQDVLGAQIGRTFTISALISIALAMLGMVLYMMIRFELSYSIAANVALIHDVIISLGIYMAFGGQLTLQTVAAVLTLIGYSVNDTIVTFDRQRENLRLLQDKTYWDIINISINQTLARTILTSVYVILILLTQFFFGGSGIRDFISIMLIGCIVGTYSSIYTASIIVAYWHKSVNNVRERIPGEEENVGKEKPAVA